MALAEAAWKRDTVPTERAAKLTVFTLWMTHLEIASPTVGSGLWGAAAPRPARRSHVISSLNSRLRFRLVRLLSLVQLYLTTGSEVERRLSTHKTRRLVWALPLGSGAGT